MKRTFAIRVAFGLCVLCCAFGTACSRPKSAAELAGIYVADYPEATECLVLDGAGRFVQTVVLKSTGETVRNEGAWGLDSGRAYIHFEHFSIVLDGFGKLRTDWKSPAKGLVVYPVNVFGTPTIGADPGIEYVKR